MGSPMVMGGAADTWSTSPPLPEGLSLLEDGSITGIARALGDSNHTVTASNSGGSIETAIRIITLHGAYCPLLPRASVLLDDRRVSAGHTVL